MHIEQDSTLAFRGNPNGLRFRVIVTRIQNEGTNPLNLLETEQSAICAVVSRPSIEIHSLKAEISWNEHIPFATCLTNDDGLLCVWTRIEEQETMKIFLSVGNVNITTLLANLRIVKDQNILITQPALNCTHQVHLPLHERSELTTSISFKYIIEIETSPFVQAEEALGLRWLIHDLKIKETSRLVRHADAHNQQRIHIIGMLKNASLITNSTSIPLSTTMYAHLEWKLELATGWRLDSTLNNHKIAQQVGHSNEMSVTRMLWSVLEIILLHLWLPQWMIWLLGAMFVSNLEFNMPFEWVLYKESQAEQDPILHVTLVLSDKAKHTRILLGSGMCRLLQVDSYDQEYFQTSFVDTIQLLRPFQAPKGRLVEYYFGTPCLSSSSHIVPTTHAANVSIEWQQPSFTAHNVSERQANDDQMLDALIRARTRLIRLKEEI